MPLDHSLDANYGYNNDTRRLMQQQAQSQGSTVSTSEAPQQQPRQPAAKVN